MSTFHERKAQRTEQRRLADLQRKGTNKGAEAPCDPPRFISEPIDDDEFVQMLMDRDMG